MWLPAQSPRMHGLITPEINSIKRCKDVGASDDLKMPMDLGIIKEKLKKSNENFLDGVDKKSKFRPNFWESLLGPFDSMWSFSWDMR